VGGNVLGVVLNNVDIRTDASYQYYTSYYTYYSPTNGEGTVTKRRKDRRPSTAKPTPRATGSTSVVERVTAGTSGKSGGDIF
jgi:polysaccharide biosynthesis transport protein